MSTGWALLTSLALLIANGFFVAAEFALVASKPHRLANLATRGSKSAAAALAGSRELSLMLAGAQLGITVCSLGLGALAEPAIAHLIDPALRSLGAPEELSYAVAFVVSLAVVVFSHMVVGEMAPKSWAISHPERAALLLALPFRGFTAVVRHVLVALNGIANAALRLVGVPPATTLTQKHGPEELRLLLHQSREHGLLPGSQHRLLTRLLSSEQTRIGDLMIPAEKIVTIGPDAGVSDVEALSRATGRSRLVVAGEGGRIIGMVHVRDAVLAAVGRADSRMPERPTVRDLMGTILMLSPDLTVEAAIRQMRAHSAHIALVGAEPTLGLVALEDLLEQVLGAFDDETDLR